MASLSKILILKTGAAGDIVRTTSLLQYFRHAAVTWITDAACIPLFETSTGNNLEVYPIDNIPETVLLMNFNLVLSLEEDEYCAKLAGKFLTEKLTGVYWDKRIAYTIDAAGWFDMSLISAFGSAVANDLKKANTKTFQDHLFAMLQLPFSGELYSIYQPASKRYPGLIGIEKTAGHRWPNKTWRDYDLLVEALQANGFQVLVFEKCDDLTTYMELVNSCSLLISGDTLAMHLAMAYKIPVVGIFNCTSPAEIYDYNYLYKLISPRLEDYFYSTSFNTEAVSAINMDTVLEAVFIQWQKFYPVTGQIKVQEIF